MGFRYYKDGVPGQSDFFMVMVESKNDLAGIEDTMPGMIAFTAGFKKMWQLSAAGEWANMLGEDDDE